MFMNQKLYESRNHVWCSYHYISSNFCCPLYVVSSTILIDLSTEIDDALTRDMWQIMSLRPLLKNKHELQWRSKKLGSTKHLLYNSPHLLFTLFKKDNIIPLFSGWATGDSEEGSNWFKITEFLEQEMFRNYVKKTPRHTWKTYK